MDPLAADYASWSTYNYVLGNPKNNIDPDGRAVEDCCPQLYGAAVGSLDNLFGTNIRGSVSFASADDRQQFNEGTRKADIVDSYLDFYSKHVSYNEFSLANAIDYVFGGPNLPRAKPIGGAGPFEFIGGAGPGVVKAAGVTFKGLIQNRPLRELTHHELTKAFKGTGFKLSNHAITRLKDIRTKKLGFNTLNDIKRVINKGTEFDAKRGLKGIGLDGLQIIYNPKTNVIVTIKPGL